MGVFPMREDFAPVESAERQRDSHAAFQDASVSWLKWNHDSVKAASVY